MIPTEFLDSYPVTMWDLHSSENSGIKLVYGTPNSFISFKEVFSEFDVSANLIGQDAEKKFRR